MYPGTLLNVPVPVSQVALDPQVLFHQALALPMGTTLVCQRQPLHCSARLLNCHLVPLQGEVLLLHLLRGVWQGNRQV